MGGKIREYLRPILRWWWLLIVSAIVPMAVTYHFTSQEPDLYQAKATIMVGTSLQNPDPDRGEMDISNTLAAAYAELIRQGPFLKPVIERLGLERSPEDLAAQIGTWVYSRAQLLEIQVIDHNPEAAALIANALADELIRRSPASGGSDPEQQEFIKNQLGELQAKIANVREEINTLTASLSELTSAAEIQEAQDRITKLEEVMSLYQSTYANLLDVYRAESPNVLSLFDPATVPQSPIPSKTRFVVAISGAAGIGLALGAIFLMAYLDTSLRWEGEGKQSVLQLPVLGAVPQVSRKGAAIGNNPLSPVAEGIRAVQANIYLLRPDQPFRTLLLTSPGASEGKSFILAHLAVALASAGNRVIAVDADMRRPSLHELFDQPNISGLANVLSNHMSDREDSLSVPLQETNFDDLYLLSAGQPPIDPSSLLTSPRFPALLEFLKSRGDIILINSPPVLGPPDATVLATLAEGTIMVASVGLSRRELIQRAKDRLLAQPGVHLLGVTVNRAKLNGSYYYYNTDQKGKEPRQKIDHSDAEWLTLDQAATYLGVNKSMARRWCKTGRLTTHRSGLRLQVSRDDVDQLIQVQTSDATVDSGAPA